MIRRYQEITKLLAGIILALFAVCFILPFVFGAIASFFDVIELSALGVTWVFLFVHFCPAVIALEGLVFFYHFLCSPQKNACLIVCNLVSILCSASILALTIIGWDVSVEIRWIPASIILLSWLIEFSMRKSLNKREVTE